MGKKNRGKGYNNPNFWGMMQNVLIASLNKGQFIIGLIGFIFLIMVLKLTPEDTKELLIKIINLFGDIYYVGWIIAIFSTFGWYFGTKRIRKIHASEMERVSNEKKQLQQKLTNKRLNTSK